MTPDSPLGSSDPNEAAPTGLDPAALARLRELDPDNRRGMLQRVFSTFEASLLRVLTQLRTASSASDAAVVMALAHTLKSSSASIGALALSAACAKVESRLRSGRPGDLQADVASLLQECESALIAVRAMLQA